MDQGEFGTSSSVADIVSVECEPVYAEHYVTISANELYSRCDKTLYWSEAAPFELTGSQPSYKVRLDNDGNGGAVLWGGPSCAAGESLVAAHLDEAPFTTVTTSFTVLPPRPTEPGVIAEPSAGAVEAEENSSAAAIIEVEFPPVFAEEPVNINAAQLDSRCHQGELTWVGPEGEILGYGLNSTTSGSTTTATPSLWRSAANRVRPARASWKRASKTLRTRPGRPTSTFCLRFRRSRNRRKTEEREVRSLRT